MTQHRMQWYDETLIKQIVEGKKTATVRPLAWADGLDDHNTALRVGQIYSVHDRALATICHIRVTCVELCSWGVIPNRLWQRDPAADGTVSLQAFKNDHREFFDDPDEGFQFLAVYFELLDEPVT